MSAFTVRGEARLIQDEDRLLQIVTRYVDTYEAPNEVPWQLKDEDETFVRKLLKGIVGFEIEIDQLEGKFKLNQNHSKSRRERVVDALQAKGDENSSRLAQLMSDSINRNSS